MQAYGTGYVERTLAIRIKTEAALKARWNSPFPVAREAPFYYDTAQPCSWSYDYKREKSGDWEHYRIVPQIAPRTELSTAVMKLPEGWSAELPAASGGAARPRAGQGR